MKTFVIGDIHGRVNALKEVLKKCKFDYIKDKLIVIGDVVDRGKQSFEVVEELLKIKDVIFIKGNHDYMFINFFLSGEIINNWLNHGGIHTVESYNGFITKRNGIWSEAFVLCVPKKHQIFFNNAITYHIQNNMLFVHGGFNPAYPIEEQDEYDLMWDRKLVDYAKQHQIKQYKKVFVGHTPTQTIKQNCTNPIKINNLWAMDCGAGFDGKLAIMNIDSEVYWLSKIQQGKL